MEITIYELVFLNLPSKMQYGIVPIQIRVLCINNIGLHNRSI